MFDLWISKVRAIGVRNKQHMDIVKLNIEWESGDAGTLFETRQTLVLKEQKTATHGKKQKTANRKTGSAAHVGVGRFGALVSGSAKYAKQHQEKVDKVQIQ